MILSVIIVHYRVPYFLEVCLLSVEKAVQGLDAEILVVDNHSVEDFPGLLRTRFPGVKWIINAENLGFARANNQALQQASGDHILFLNPDTILPEDFACRCLAFVGRASSLSTGGTSRGGQSAGGPSIGGPSIGGQSIGGLGVRMIDGSGRFLQESRRGFPTPWVAFCKVAGLTSLFPHSRWFSRYYLGWLPAGGAHPSPVLSGACLWASKAALQAAGSFDERFFMYAEDIDLSYRLQQAGYTNYYLGETTIIHFKGASTPKDLWYTRQFYTAMSQFASKHFNGGSSSLRLPVKIGIRLRAMLSSAGTLFGAKGNEAGAKGRAGGAKGNATNAGLSKPRRVWLAGDPAGIGLLQSRVPAFGRLAADPGSAQEIIFCQGDSFSFKQMIGALQEIGPGQTASIYAAGARAVISSPRRDNTGEVRIL